MGWASGSLLMSEIIDGLKDEIPDDATRLIVYKTMIPLFEDYDCDNLEENVDQDPVFKEAYEQSSYFATEETDEDEEDDPYEDYDDKISSLSDEDEDEF